MLRCASSGKLIIDPHYLSTRNLETDEPFFKTITPLSLEIPQLPRLRYEDTIG